MFKNMLENVRKKFPLIHNITLVFENTIHAVQTAKADEFTFVCVFDAGERQQTALCSTSDYYLAVFGHIEAFREFASAK